MRRWNAVRATWALSTRSFKIELLVCCRLEQLPNTSEADSLVGQKHAHLWGSGRMRLLRSSGLLLMMMLLVGVAAAARLTRRCERRLGRVRGAVLAHVAAAERGARTLQGARGGEEGAARAARRSMLRALGGGRNLDDVQDQVARMQLAKVAPDCAEDEGGRRLWSALRTELMEAASSAAGRVSPACLAAPPPLRRVAAAALGPSACGL